jgi:hypothetical protein
MPSSLFAILQYCRVCLAIDGFEAKLRPQYRQTWALFSEAGGSMIGAHGVLRVWWRLRA